MSNQKRLINLILCLFTASSTSLFAKEATWKNEIEVGLNGTSGDSKSMNVHTGYAASYKDADKGWKFITAYDKAKIDGVESKNQFFADLLKDWFWSNSPWFAFVQGRYNWDKFKDWDYRLSTSSGVGYELLNNDNWYLAGRMGIGGNKTYGDDIEEVFTTEALFCLDANWTISEHESIEFKTTFYPSLEESGEYRNITTFNWRMSVSEYTRLAMKIGLINEYDSLAAPNTEKNDIKYNLSLVWGL